jgi:PPE family
MEFTTLPPEVTSALIHTGPGAESLIEASEAWQQLGANLEDSAENYGATLSSLVGTWRGASSTAMVQAVEPYVNWLRTTAQQVQQTAASALAAASAVNSVRAAVVPVGQVSANRALLAQLLATNGFGRNLPAIAETEAEYQSMWANNSAAMNRYQAASAQASTLPRFSSPSSTTNPAGTAKQSSAVSAATTSSSPTVSAATPAQTSQVNLGFADPTTGYFGLANVYANQFVSSGFPINLLSYLAQNQSAQALQGVNAQIGQGVSEGESALGGGAAGGLGGLGRAGYVRPGCVGRRWTRPSVHVGGDGCRRVDWQADRAARRGGIAARSTSASATRFGRIAALRGRIRTSDAAAAHAAADFGRQWLAQAQGAKVRRYCDRCRAQGKGDGPTAIGGMSNPAQQLRSCWQAAQALADNQGRS